MQPKDTIAGRFELERIAGEGGMGAVWRARDRTTNQLVALKVMHEADVARIEREATLLAGLTHPAIVRYVAHGSDTDTQWVAMEWLEGVTLEHHIARAAMSLHQSLALVKRIAEALATVHAAGVVHRDVKPSNILMTSEGPKLLDFGIARSKLTARLTRTGTTIGTPGYMAPEQARGDHDVGPSADVFSLGCVLFECIARSPVFIGEHFVAVLAKVLMQEAQRLSDVVVGIPVDVDSLVTRMLMKDPNQRPANGAAVVEALGAILQTMGQMEGSTLVAAPVRSADTASIGAEAKLASVILLGPDVSDDARSMLAELRAIGASFGAALEVIADGSVLAFMARQGTAKDQAFRGARLALALHHALPTRPCSLAMGRASVTGSLPVGEAIDRASRLVRMPTVKGVRLDEGTRGLLEAGFEIDEGVLRAEREKEELRTVLGKPVPCVGRESELGLLQGVFDHTTEDGVASVALITAPAGAGKSRLLHELAVRLRSRAGSDFQMWTGRGDPMRAGSPLGILGDALRRELGVQSGESIETARERVRSRVGRNVAPHDANRIAWFIGEIVGVLFDASEGVSLVEARRDPQLMGDQMRRAFEDFVIAESASSTLVFVVEDLHWGDAPTVSFLDSTLRVASERPFFVIATGRPEVHQLFPSLWKDRNLLVKPLGDLTKKASERFVRAVLPDASAETVQQIIERGEGSPLFLEELIRAQAEGRGETPASVLAMVQSRLEALPESLRRVLRAGSVFGGAFWKGAIAPLLGMSDLVLDASLQTLAEREILVAVGDSKFPNERELAYRHDTVREAAWSMLTDEDRVLAHRHAGQWLARKGESDAFVLAEHMDKGGDHTQAVALYVRAAHQALESNDLDAALRRAERGVACGAEGEQRGALRAAQAEAEHWLGATQAAAEHADLALSDFTPGSDEWVEALSLRIALEVRIGDRDVAVKLATRLLERSIDGPVVAAARLRAANSVLVMGDPSLAQALASGTSAFEEPGARHSRGRYVAMCAAYEGDAAGALEASIDALRAAEDADHTRWQITARQNLGFDFRQVGDYASAERELTRALDEAKRLGLHSSVAGAKQELGMACARLGALSRGIALERQSAEEFAAQGDVRMQGASLTYGAWLLAEAGEVAAAEADARTAIAILRAVAPPVLPFALAALSLALRQQGRASEALAAAREAHALLDSPIEEGESLVRLEYAEALRSTTELPAAREAIAQAKTRLLERASKITNPEVRKSFLERVPEHARTLAM